MMKEPILYKKLTILIVHACLGIWLEPVVSRSYHFPGRQYVTKSLKVMCFNIIEKASYDLTYTTKRKTCFNLPNDKT